MIRKQIKEFKKDIKESSLEGYIRTLKHFSKEMFGSTKNWNPKYFGDFETISAYFQDDTKNICTRKTRLIAVLVYLKSIPKDTVSDLVIGKYSGLLRDLNKLQDESYLKQEQSPKESKNWMTLEEIYALRDKHKERSINATKIKDKLDMFQMYLVLSLYTKMAPIRNDYANVDIVYNDKFLETNKTDCSKNFIELVSGKLILCDYKTNKKFGRKIIDLPQPLVLDIKEWMNLRKGYIQHNRLLVNKLDWSPMTRNGLSHYFKKCLGKNVSTTMLRKIYLSERYPVVNTTEDQRSDAFIMSHSIGTQQSIYRKKLISTSVKDQ